MHCISFHHRASPRALGNQLLIFSSDLLLAVAKMGGVFILSTLSTSSIEEVAEAAPDATRWFQLYIYKDRYTWVSVFVNGSILTTNSNREL